MASSKIKIANMALALVGSRRISDFSESSAEARAVNEFYADIRDEVLCEGLWTFAQKRAALNQVDETPALTEDNIDVVYAKPSDFLKLNFISDVTALVKVEGTRILSDTTGIKIIYTYRNDDPTTYYPKFVMALVHRLASTIAFQLTNSKTVAENLYKYYTDVLLPQALSSDAQQGTPHAASQDEWLNAMMQGSGAIATTGETWHPFL